MANKELKSIKFPGLADTYTVNSMPDGASANQQLVTDADGSTKWVGRTHYAETAIVTALPEISFTSQDVKNGLYGWFSTEHTINEIPESGEVATVVFDGKEYACAARDNAGAFYYGNTGPMGGDDTGEPFCLIVMPSVGIQVACFTDAEPTVHSIALYMEREAVHTIDPKYLPEIPAEKLPTIPAEKLPTIPAEKLPTIPATKLAKTFVIKIKVESAVLFASTSAYECDFGGNTALYAAQMLRDQKAVIETTDGCRYAPCTNMNFDESGDGNYITFVLVNVANDIVEIAILSIMNNSRIGISRIINLSAT